MARETPPGDLMSVDAARAAIIADIAPLAREDIALTDGLGRVLAEPLVARRSQPPMAVSAMDGFAARSADVAAVPAVLTQIGAVQAGGAFDGTVGPGQCTRIFTGAPVPDGADTIVIQEDTTLDGDQVTVREGAPAGRYIRPAGLDFNAGDTVLPAGRLLTARDIGLAAALNYPWLPVRRKPRVAILASGDEIVRPGEPVGGQQIVSSNSYALAAMVTAMGGEPVVLGIAGDSAEALRQTARAARGCDLLVTSGGASVGDHDLIQSALGSDEDPHYRLDVGFWRIAMRPGKPLIFGRYGPIPMLGLPGNPVSTVICAMIFLQPLVDRLLGLPVTEAPRAPAILDRDLAANDRRQDYLRCRLETDENGALRAHPFSRQDSAILSLMAAADGLLVRPPFDPARRAGEKVEILRFASTAWRF